MKEILMACDNCGGGDRNIHLTNPDPAVTEVVVDENIVFHPQPGTPYSWCVHDLRNVFDSVLDYEGLLPFVWDQENCIAGPGRWPCPDVEHWDSAFIETPQPDQCGDCDSGQWSFWFDDAIGLLTHVCIDGELVELGGQGSGGGGGGGCCTPWSMVDGACNPILVVKTSTGWKFYDEDLTSVARPQTLAWPESCAGEGCPTCWDITQAPDGTVTIIGDDGTITIQPPETATACPNCVEITGNLDGSFTVTQSTAADVVIPAPPPGLGTTTVTSGGVDYTGVNIGGTKVVADAPMVTTTPDPEVDYPAVDFPFGWEQIFIDPLGESTIWVRLDDTLGPVWKQSTN